MKTTKILILSLFFICIIPLIFSNNADAISYYNWLDNPSFVQYTEYIEDGSFESGLFEQGSEYGDWNFTDTGSSNPTISLVNPHTGVYSCLLATGADDSPYYNLTYAGGVLGADIENITFWLGGNPTSTEQCGLYVYYTDATYDTDTYTATQNVWTQYSCIDIINPVKYVIRIMFTDTDSDSYTYYFDDVSMLVDDGGGQDMIDSASEPWSSSGINGNIEMVDDFGRIDDYSVAFTEESSLWVHQRINYLMVDNCHFIECYVYVESEAVEIEDIVCEVSYSDGSTDYRHKDFSAYDSWVNINFGSTWLDSGKFITNIWFKPYSIGEDGVYNSALDYSFTGTVYIDDCGLWSTIEDTGISRLVFSLSPTSINKGSNWFMAYSGVEYTMSFTYYNSTTEELNVNGTYTIHDNFGETVGSFTNSVFTYQMDKRNFNASPYTAEYMTVRVVSGNEIFQLFITCWWYPESTNPNSSSGGSTINDVSGDFMINFFTLGIFLLVIPISITGAITGIFAGGGNSVAPSLILSAFLASETLMSAIALSVNIINIWFMLAIIIVDVIVIVAMTKR